MKHLFNVLMHEISLIEIFAQSLLHNPGITSAGSDLTLQHYASGDIIEAYVEAELNNGCAVAWWMDIHRVNGKYLLESKIVGNDTQGEYTIERFPNSIVDFKTVSTAFRNAVMQAKGLDLYASKTAKAMPHQQDASFKSIAKCLNNLQSFVFSANQDARLPCEALSVYAGPQLTTIA